MIRDSLVPAPRAGRVIWPTATVHAGVYQPIVGPDKTKSALALLMSVKYRNHLAPITEEVGSGLFIKPSHRFA
jgi:hypothetical protein